MFYIRIENNEIKFKQGILIGRLSPIDEFRGDEKLSREHAEIYVEDDKAILRDLGSSNGTFLNDKKIKPSKRYYLLEGDIIKVGETEFVFGDEAKLEEFLKGKQYPESPEELAKKKKIFQYIFIAAVIILILLSL